MFTQFIYAHMSIYRNLTPYITKGQKRVKKGQNRVQNRKKWYNLKMLIEIPFMSSIFGIFTQIIYAHMSIYRNLTPNITKGQKWVKKGSKIGKKYYIFGKIWYHTLIMALMSAIFGMFTQFLHAHMKIYKNLTPNIIKGQKWAKKGQKRVQNR